MNTTMPYCPGCRRRHERSSDADTPLTIGGCSQISPPSPLEQKMFYLGIPSCPRLVGRVSSASTKWKTPREQWDEFVAQDNADTGYFHCESKYLTCIGNHLIIKKWHGIQDKILYYISGLGLPWNAVDVFRIVCRGSKPVVVWIAVSHNASPWQLVLGSLLGCKEILDGVGLHDVDVQIRLATLNNLGLIPPRTGSDFCLRMHQHIQPLSTGVGLSIYPHDQPTRSGSVGVYLRPKARLESEEESPMWALTFRHVVLPGDINLENDDFPYDEDHPVASDIHFGTQSLVGTALAAAYDEKQLHEERRRKHGHELSGACVASETISDLHKIRMPIFRLFGKVVLAPSVSVAESGRFRWLRDWALVQVKTGIQASLPVNVADLRSRVQRDVLDRDLDVPSNCKPFGVKPFKFVLPPDGLLQLSGIFPIRKMFSSPRNDVDDAEITGNADNNDNSDNTAADSKIGGYIVGKRGAQTGMTWGMASEIQSVTRVCLPDGQEMRATEWAVATLPDHCVPSFSTEGDSGSDLFTVDGRVAGFLTRGSDASSGCKVDVTYATPAEFVLADVSRRLRREVCLV